MTGLLTLFGGFFAGAIASLAASYAKPCFDASFSGLSKRYSESSEKCRQFDEAVQRARNDPRRITICAGLAVSNVVLAAMLMIISCNAVAYLSLFSRIHETTRDQPVELTLFIIGCVRAAASQAESPTFRGRCVVFELSLKRLPCRHRTRARKTVTAK